MSCACYFPKLLGHWYVGGVHSSVRFELKNSIELGVVISEKFDLDLTKNRFKLNWFCLVWFGFFFFENQKNR